MTHKQNTINSISASEEGNVRATSERLHDKGQNNYIHYPLDWIHMSIIIHKEKKKISPHSMLKKPQTNQKNSNPKTNKTTPQHPTHKTPPDLRANQVIQELGAGKEQKALNSNSLT